MRREGPWQLGSCRAGTRPRSVPLRGRSLRSEVGREPEKRYPRILPRAGDQVGHRTKARRCPALGKGMSRRRRVLTMAGAVSPVPAEARAQLGKKVPLSQELAVLLFGVHVLPPSRVQPSLSAVRPDEAAGNGAPEDSSAALPETATHQEGAGRRGTSQDRPQEAPSGLGGALEHAAGLLLLGGRRGARAPRPPPTPPVVGVASRPRVLGFPPWPSSQVGSTHPMKTVL